MPENFAREELMFVGIKIMNVIIMELGIAINDKRDDVTFFENR
jgi:hypothetical protein